MNVPSNLKYTESDEWVLVEGTTATIGVTDYAQEALSDVVFFEAVVSVGDSIKAKSQIATLESVKAAADVNAPLAGKILEVNEDLGSSPELVNSDPYGKAWMVKLEIADPAALSKLMDAVAYEKFLETRSH